MTVGTISMSQESLKRYRLAMDVVEGKLSLIDFSILIGVSYRQAQRIVIKVEQMGDKGVLHGNIGKAPWNKTPAVLEHQILDLLNHSYKNFNLTHFREKLESDHKIKIKKDALHSIAKKHSLVKNPKRRRNRSHRPRARLPREGMMIQFDGSRHKWFGEFKTDLIGGIDDATGIVVAAEFFYGETSNHSMKVIREIIDNYGLPESFYMDQAAMYGKIDREWESQISRAFDQTGIRLLLASSSQAKGRIERLWRTFQDRLIAELELNQITEITEANKYLKKIFLPAYNKQFSIPAEEKESAYRKNVFGNLDNIFCKKVERKITEGNIFSWEGVYWQIENFQNLKGRRINVNIKLNGSYSFDVMGKEMKCKISNQMGMKEYRAKNKIKEAA